MECECRPCSGARKGDRGRCAAPYVLKARTWKIKPSGLRAVIYGRCLLSLPLKVVRSAVGVDGRVMSLRVTVERMVKSK